MKVLSQQAGAIVLAAGFGRRFGDTKQLAYLTNGRTVLEQTLLNLRHATDNILVVTREEIKPAVNRLGIECCVFENANQGMGASLAFAVSQIPNWDSVMVCLGDMPFIAAASYETLIAASDNEHIIVPTIGTDIANPCVFGKRFYSELKQLQGDKGGRAIINKHPEAVIMLAMDDPGLLQDIDTPTDLTALQP